MTTRRPYWATIRDHPERTRDVLLQARSEWSAWWLARVLHPRAEVLVVRPASRSLPTPGRSHP
jgi:hypothetical protein